MENSESSFSSDINTFENRNDMLANHTDSGGDEEGNVKEEYRMFSSRSISITASSIGISSISEDVCKHIAEELYYKTKELIYMSKLILNQNKRSTLTTNDVKKAMKLLGGLELYGHNSNDDVNFIHVPKSDVFIEEDPEFDILHDALSDNNYTHKGDPYIRGAWVMPEGYSEDPSIVTTCTYYQKIAKTIMTGSPAHIRVALSDLRTNPKIGPVCPYFLNLVALTVKKVPRDTHLTNALIGTVHAIAHNKFVDPSPYLAVNRAVNSLLKIVIEGNIDKVGDDYVDKDDDLAVRMRAGLLLAKVVIMWSIELKQQIDIVRHLLHHLLDPDVPLQSHYGAIVALTALGQRRLGFYFWPLMERYLPQLESKVGSNKTNIMVQHVMAAILVAARSTYKKEQGSNPDQLKQLYEVDKMLYATFGDSVTPLRMVANPPIFKCVKTPISQSRLKLRLCRTTKNKHNEWRKPLDLCSVFENFQRLPCLTNNVFNDRSEYKRRVFYCVQRNYKFCRPLHVRSASGDLLLML